MVIRRPAHRQMTCSGGGSSCFVDLDSFTVEFVVRAPIKRPSELFDPLRVASTG
jgi:hypothetical protein